MSISQTLPPKAGPQPTLKANTLQSKVRLLSIDDLPLYVKFLVYANAGVGKTYLAATAPDPIILLTETEVSIPTLKLVAQTRGITPQIVIIDSLEEMDNVLDYLETRKLEGKTVVLDSLTDLNRFIKLHMIKEGMKRRPAHDVDIAEISDWQRIEDRTRSYIRRLRDLPMHVVCICLLTDIGEEAMVAPSIQPKRLMYEAAAYFNMVGELSVKAPIDKKSVITRELIVEAGRARIAKNPGGSLPPVVENPDLTEIFKTVVTQLGVSRAVAVLKGNAGQTT